MEHILQNASRLFAFLVVPLLILLAAPGCDAEPSISVYKVAREDSEVRGSSSSKVIDEQVLGAIVPQGSSVWFFKLRGEVELVERFGEEFRQTVENLGFAESGPPEWELPEGWVETPGDAIFLAKWLHSESGLQATVSRFSVRENEAWEEYVKRNVNRWRGQLSLASENWEALREDLTTLDELTTDERRPAYYVSLIGRSSGSNSMGGGSMGSNAPFLESLRNSGTGPTLKDDNSEANVGSAGSSPASSQPEPLTYEIPEGWVKVKPKNSMRTAQFESTVDGEKLEVIVSQAGGEIEQNMSMWLGQVGGVPTERSVSSIVKDGSKVDNATSSATMYRIAGAEHGGATSDAMVVSEIPITDTYSWYVKMVGSESAVDASVERFKEFVSSINFEKP